MSLIRLSEHTGMVPKYRRRGFRKQDKKGVLIAIAALHGTYQDKIGMELQQAGLLSMSEAHPYFYDGCVKSNQKPIEAVRNAFCELMERTRYEYLMFWDDDSVPPDNWTELIGKGDVVSGTTWMWKGAEDDPSRRLQFNQFEIVNQKGTRTVRPKSFTEPYEVDCVGAHCMVIHRRVLEKLGWAPFDTHATPDGAMQEGEDIRFCRKARAAGFKVTIVPNVIFDHMYTVSLKGVYEMVCALTSKAVKEERARMQAEVREMIEQAKANAARQEDPAGDLSQQVEAAG